MTKISSDGVKSNAEKKPSCVRKWPNERVRGGLVEKVNHPGPSGVPGRGNLETAKLAQGALWGQRDKSLECMLR